MTEQMSPAEIARKALEILDRDGWCKYQVTWTSFAAAMYSGSDYRLGSHCLSGAWGEVVGTLSGRELKEAYAPLAAVVREQYPAYAQVADPAYPLTIIPAVNDAPDVTEADVRAILEKVIASGS